MSVESENAGDMLRRGEERRSGDGVRRLEDKPRRLKPVVSLSEVSEVDRWMPLSASERTAYGARGASSTMKKEGFCLGS